jgi:hypothetical protein
MSDFFERGPGEQGTRMARREASRRRTRRRRGLVFVVLVRVVLAVALAVFKPWQRWAHKGARPGPPVALAGASAGPSAAATGSGGPAASPSASPTAQHGVSPSPAESGVSPSPGASAGIPAPPIVSDLIPYGATRKAEMAAFCKRHYGQDTWVLHPKVIVLHYTATSTYASAHATFAANAPALGELPGVAAHFVIDENGTIYQQVPLDVRCRHAVGLDWCAIGIEFVQPAASGPAQAIADIFARQRQVDAGLRLVAWLQATYDIPTDDVIGHAMANASPFFKDLTGARNDHVDWNAAAVTRFRQALDDQE